MERIFFALLTLCLLLSGCQFLNPPDNEQEAIPVDASTIRWEAVADAPLVRFEAQSAVVDGKLYTFGGYTDGSIMPKSFEANVYDPEADTWENLPDLPRPLTHAGTASDGESIYFAGGVVGSDDPDETAKISATTEVWRYHTQTRKWTPMPPLPEARGAGALVVLNDTLHFFGGTGLDRYTEVAEHWALELGSDTWEARAPLTNPRNHLSGIVVDGSIYAIGGQHGHNETLTTQDTVERYNPQNDSWEERQPLPHGLGHVQNTTVEVDGRIFIVGGETSDYGTYTDEVLVYDPKLDTWTRSTDFSTAENSLIGGAIGNSIFITGGSGRSYRTLKGTIEN